MNAGECDLDEYGPAVIYFWLDVEKAVRLNSSDSVSRKLICEQRWRNFFLRSYDPSADIDANERVRGAAMTKRAVRRKVDERLRELFSLNSVNVYEVDTRLTSAAKRYWAREKEAYGSQERFHVSCGYLLFISLSWRGNGGCFVNFAAAKDLQLILFEFAEHISVQKFIFNNLFIIEKGGQGVESGRVPPPDSV
ncbi:hypothetical protein ACFE04_011134 [Oxalis oulophora]